MWRTFLAFAERRRNAKLDRLATVLNRREEQADNGTGFNFIRMVYMKETPSAEDPNAVTKIVFWSGPQPPFD